MVLLVIPAQLLFHIHTVYAVLLLMLKTKCILLLQMPEVLSVTQHQQVILINVIILEQLIPKLWIMVILLQEV